MIANIFPLGIVCAFIACTDAPAVVKAQWQTAISKTDTLIDFSTKANGKLPEGFKGFNSCSQAVNWAIEEESGNKFVMQKAKNESSCFNVLMLQGKSYQDFTATVKIKALAGEEDQGGGLIWRCQNENNYYLARYNPLENNFRFYKVVNGNRKQLKSIDCNIKSGEWFTMAISMNGNNISCSLNGTKMIETSDDTYPNAGKVGLWTKSDAQSYFDDLSVKPM